MVLLSFKTTPVYSAFYSLRNLINAFIPTANIFITAWFIETALRILRDGANIGSIALPIVFLASIMVYNVFLSRLFGFFDLKNTHVFRTRIGAEVLEKRAQLQYRCMEDQSSLDLIMRVARSPGDAIKSMYTATVELVQLSIATLGIIATIFMQVWLVGAIFCIATVPIVYLAIRAGKATYTASRDMSEVDRKAHALSGALRDRRASEERTLFGYSDELGRRFDEAFDYARRYRLKVDMKYYFKNKIAGVICTLLSLVAAAAMLPSVGRGELAIGMFIALVGATLGLTGRFSSLNGIVVDFTQKREYLRDLSDFMALPEEKDACDLPEAMPSFETIEFREVSFKYPGTEKLILDKVSFSIRAGYNYSFVGANGAGKTTVIKLLTGLYSDYEGEILIDGKSLGSMSSARRKGLSAVVYQDFAKYAITLRDNISFGDINSKDMPDTEQRILEKMFSLQLDNALSNLPRGIDTPLGKVFQDSVDLSGGEGSGGPWRAP